MVKEISNLSGEIGKLASKNLKLSKQLSSGKKVVSAADDPAALAIANTLASDVRLSQQARRNNSDATSALNIAGSAVTQISDISGRMSELATQAANGTLSKEQRTALDSEYKQLSAEASRIAETTEFNGISLLKGKSISVQSGIDGSAASRTTINSNSGLNEKLKNLGSQSLLSAESALSVLSSQNQFRESLGELNSEFGATTNRLAINSENLATSEENKLAAESQIMDLDIAQAQAEKISGDVKMQMSTALSAQAGKLQSQKVLSLIT
jgi:flagellin